MTMDERFDRIDTYLRDMRGETAQRLEAIENRLDILASDAGNRPPSAVK